MHTFFWLEITLLSNVALIFLPLKKLTRKLGSLFIITVLMGCLLFVLKVDDQSLLLLGFVDGDFFWSAFIIDRLSAFFAALTFLLVFLCVSLVGAHTFNQLAFFLVLFMLELLLFHTFTATNLLTFYATFEATLVPMFILILLWGSRQRKLHAMYMFFFYTVIGSVFLLLGLLSFYYISGSLLLSSIIHLEPVLTFFSYLVWVCFFVGFAFKVPVVPFHTWLPEAHVEAPTSGSIILAGLLLKVGTFGMLRFMFPSLNVLNYNLQTPVYVISVLSVFYASLIAIRQLDIKKIVAYSSVAHMGFVVAGLFSLTYFGFIGSYFTMVSHGVVASALFFLVGIIYERYKTRNLLYYGGLASVMPIFAFCFFLFVLANIGFPFTSNFIGELYILLGIFSTNLFIGLCAIFSIVLPPIYSVWLFNRIFFGHLSSNLSGFADINLQEAYNGALLTLLMLLGGACPKIITLYTELEYMRYLV